MFKKITNYCKESYDELVHKVSWPTRSELSSSAVVVLYASLLIALVVFLMDSAFQFVSWKTLSIRTNKQLIRMSEIEKKWYVLTCREW